MKADTLLQQAQRDYEKNLGENTFGEIRDSEQIARKCGELFQKLEPIFAKNFGTPLPEIAIGGLITWDLTAFVKATLARDAFAILVSNGAARLIDLANACRWALVSTEEGGFVRTDAEPWLRLGTILYQYAVGRFYDIRYWMLDPTMGSTLPYSIIPSSLEKLFLLDGRRAREAALEINPEFSEKQRNSFDVIMSFVVAHEVSHVLDGHLCDRMVFRAIWVKDDKVTIEANEIDWECEARADLIAMKTVVECYESDDVLEDIGFFFGVLDLIERISFRPVFWGHSHPPPSLRMKVLMEGIDSAGEAASELQRRFAKFQRSLDILAEDVLEAPGNFRKQPVVAFEKNPPGMEVIERAAHLHNEGERWLNLGQFKEAANLFEDAARIMRGQSYGEGFRLVFDKLVTVKLKQGDMEKAIDSLIESITFLHNRNDRPAVMWLLKRFSTQLASIRRPLSACEMASLEAMKYLNDAMITKYVKQHLARVEG